MEQFNLNIWLQDRSRKIVTRDGRPVRIVCWDEKNSKPIVALVSTKSISQRQFDELLISYFNDGTYYGGTKEDFLDLFFAGEGNTNKILYELKSYFEKTQKEQVEKDWKEIQDWYAQHFTNEKHNDEDGLTEFEKKLKEVLYEHATTNTSSEEKARQYASELIELARKELEKNYYTKVLDDRMVLKSELHSTDLQTAYDMGKQDALKSFPKWEKCDDNLPYSHIGGFNNRYLIKEGYCIKISDLETLPKEK